MNVTVGGVPEHFNLPWHLAIESGEFYKHNIDLQWKDYPGGTGAMCKDLREGLIDMAIVLTEGMVADIINGNTSKIVKTYVQSPLTWGIHVPANTTISNVEDLKSKRFAISREGSGSHLMAYILASKYGWDPQAIEMVVVGSLDGARKAFAENKAEGFLWEKYTTKPYIDSGEFRRVGEIPTPWPCFVIAVRSDFLNKHKEQVERIINIVSSYAKQLKQNPKAVKLIAHRYKLKEVDVAECLSQVQWNYDIHVETSMIDGVVDIIYSLGIIKKRMDAQQLIELL